MPWVRFLGRFDWSPPALRQRRTTVYAPGQILLVTTACAMAAIADGKAERIDKPKDAGRGRR